MCAKKYNVFLRLSLNVSFSPKSFAIILVSASKNIPTTAYIHAANQFRILITSLIGRIPFYVNNM